LSNSQAAGAFRPLSILEKCQYMSINVNKVGALARNSPNCKSSLRQGSDRAMLLAALSPALPVREGKIAMPCRFLRVSC